MRWSVNWMSSTVARVAGVIGTIVIAAGLVAGCSKTIPGTPRADPAQVAVGADTTCETYNTMTEAQKKAVITSIGKDNPLVQGAPELWVTLAGTLCTFADPGTTVKDVLAGQGIG
jgi:hypothetical protein